MKEKPSPTLKELNFAHELALRVKAVCEKTPPQSRAVSISEGTSFGEGTGYNTDTTTKYNTAFAIIRDRLEDDLLFNIGTTTSNNFLFVTVTPEYKKLPVKGFATYLQNAAEKIQQEIDSIKMENAAKETAYPESKTWVQATAPSSGLQSKAATVWGK